MSPTLDVVIVSYRRPGLLETCLESLRGIDPSIADLRVHVVDNSADEQAAGPVTESFPEINLIENASNRGFAAASNQGIDAGAASLVLLLNPDAALDRATLPPLFELLEGNPMVAAVGPKLVRPDGSLDHAAKRSFPTVRSALSYFTGLERLLPAARQYTAPEVESGPVDAINGAFMLIRREALDEVGLFDEGYWMYMEDLDLCYRFWQAGWQVCYEPRAVATHLKGGSAGPVRSVRLNAWFHYGMYRFYRKFYAPQRSAPVNVLVYGGIGVKLALSILRSWLPRAWSGIRRRVPPREPEA